MKRRFRLVTAACAAIAFAAAVGSVAGPGSASTQPGNVVAVAFSEWRIDVGSSTVESGPVTFDERNLGAVEHDLTIVRTSRAADDLPLGLEGVSPQSAGDVVLREDHRAHGHAGADGDHAEQHLEPGDSRRRTVSLAAGSYVLLCPIPGHYENGQAGTLTVR